MKTFVRSVIKDMFPKAVLRWRARTVISKRMDPDLYLLAKLRTQLSEVEGAEKFLIHFSKQHAGIDVGACGGEYSCIMATIFGKVVAIEPTPDMAVVLRRSLPSNCEVVECAVGEFPGEVALRVPKIGDRRQHALATVADHGFEFSNIGMIDTTTVRQLTVDQIVGERNLVPSFIKIDVEGYEEEVLLGSMKVIEAHKPILMIEIEKRHNVRFRGIFDLLGSKGYVPYHFCSGKLFLSGPGVADKSFEYLKQTEISGMNEVILSKKTERYINNFLFLPML